MAAILNAGRDAPAAFDHLRCEEECGLGVIATTFQKMTVAEKQHGKPCRIPLVDLVPVGSR